jgi:hypothetical protein
MVAARLMAGLGADGADVQRPAIDTAACAISFTPHSRCQLFAIAAIAASRVGSNFDARPHWNGSI